MLWVTIGMLTPYFPMWRIIYQFVYIHNAVESHNSLSKHDRAEILSESLLTRYGTWFRANG